MNANDDASSLAVLEGIRPRAEVSDIEDPFGWGFGEGRRIVGLPLPCNSRVAGPGKV